MACKHITVHDATINFQKLHDRYKCTNICSVSNYADESSYWEIYLSAKMCWQVNNFQIKIGIWHQEVSADQPQDSNEATAVNPLKLLFHLRVVTYVVAQVFMYIKLHALLTQEYSAQQMKAIIKSHYDIWCDAANTITPGYSKQNVHPILAAMGSSQLNWHRFLDEPKAMYVRYHISSVGHFTAP